MSKIYELTKSDLDLWFSNLEQRLRIILQDNENLLGTLEFTLDTTKTIPAIYRKTKEIQLNKWRMREDGILCVIHESSCVKPIYLLGSTALRIDFKIELIQYDRSATNFLATTRILSDNYFDIFKDPVTTPQMELPNGIALERTIIEVTATIHSKT